MNFLSGFRWLAPGLLNLLLIAPCMASPEPNVLLILADDQGFGDLHEHGNAVIDTPTLDRLANQSVRVNRFYVSPVCAPTRAALLTGQYPLRNGVYGVTGGREVMQTSALTLAEIFKANGYRTGLFGKWHNGAHYPHNPMGQGFDRFLGFTAGHLNNYFDPNLQSDRGDVQPEGYVSDILTEASARFFSETGQPFFAMLSFNTPHSPFQVPDRYFDKYHQRGLGDKDAAVYGMVENIDHNVGRLLRQLPSNTLVIYLSDNGPNGERYNAGMRGIKAGVFEGSVRVPAFFYWPERWPEGRSVAVPAAHIDLLPTLVSLLKLHVPTPVPVWDGLDLSDALNGKPVNAAFNDRAIFTRWHPDLVALPGSVRVGPWRAANTGGQWMLFNLARDPAEAKDLAQQFPQQLEQLQDRYWHWWQSLTEGRDIQPALPELGHSAAPAVLLQAHEAALVPGQGQGVDFYGKEGWANDWISRWSAQGSGARWRVKVVTPGRYKVSLQLAKSEGALALSVQAEGDAIEWASQTPLVAEAIPSQDRVPRVEVYERHWPLVEVGELFLPRGVQNLRVTLAHISQAEPELKGLLLERVD